MICHICRSGEPKKIEGKEDEWVYGRVFRTGPIKIDAHPSCVLDVFAWIGRLMAKAKEGGLGQALMKGEILPKETGS